MCTGQLDHDLFPVNPVRLVHMRPSAFIKVVFDQLRAHAAIYWSAERIDAVEDNHRNLRSFYKSADNTRKAIRGTTIQTSFDDAWVRTSP